MNVGPRFTILDACAIVGAFLIFGLGVFEGVTKNAVWLYLGSMAAAGILVAAAHFSVRRRAPATGSGQVASGEKTAGPSAGRRKRFTFFDGLAITATLAIFGLSWYMRQLGHTELMFSGSIAAAFVLVASAITRAQRQGENAASGRFSGSQKAYFFAAAALLQTALAFRLPWTFLMLFVAGCYAIVALYFAMGGVRRRIAR